MSSAGTTPISAPIGLGALADEGFARIGTEIVDGRHAARRRA